MAWTNARVGKQQRIAGVVYVDDLPRNPNGKILKRELRTQSRAPEASRMQSARHALAGLLLHVRLTGCGSTTETTRRRDRPGQAAACCACRASRATRATSNTSRCGCSDSGACCVADLRGRGRSQHDPNWQNYHPGTYLADISLLLADAGVGGASCSGTSLGGILSMMIAAARPASLAGVILNDVGPEVAPEGLARISSYVGRDAPPKAGMRLPRTVRATYEIACPG